MHPYVVMMFMPTFSMLMVWDLFGRSGGTRPEHRMLSETLVSVRGCSVSHNVRLNARLGSDIGDDVNPSGQWSRSLRKVSRTCLTVRANAPCISVYTGCCCRFSGFWNGQLPVVQFFCCIFLRRYQATCAWMKQMI